MIMDIKNGAMRTKYIIILVSGLLGCTFMACKDDIDPIITELGFDRVLSPIGLEAAIRNQTTIELDWSTREDVDHYIVEFSEDSLEFASVIRSITVQPEELPIQETFFGDTRYSARVKAISATDVEESKWSVVTIRTQPENILLPIVVNEDIGISEVTIKWPTGQFALTFCSQPWHIEIRLPLMK